MPDFYANGSGNIAVECEGVNGAAAFKATTDTNYCIYAESATDYAVVAFSGTSNGINATSSSGTGVFGRSDSSAGVAGLSNTNTGVAGQSQSGPGVTGTSFGNSPGIIGESNLGPGVSASSGTGTGVIGGGITGIEGYSTGTTGAGVLGHPPTSGQGFAGKFLGDVDVQGTLTKSAGTFKLDHPLDPALKYLTHAFVEAAVMKDLYDGIAMLDDAGEAVVELPDWFEALNTTFRYQLTCIGGYAPVYIAQKIQNHRFKIAGGNPGMEVSWLVTGIRHDPYALAHAFAVEEEKSEEERGYYRHPELYSEPEERRIAWVQFPGHMQRLKQIRP